MPARSGRATASGARTMRRRRFLGGSDEGEENFWPALADVTSTIALVLFVLVLLAYIQNLISGKKFAASQREIAAAARRLDDLEGSLRRTRAETEAAQRRLRLA